MVAIGVVCFLVGFIGLLILLMFNLFVKFKRKERYVDPIWRKKNYIKLGVLAIFLILGLALLTISAPKKDIVPATSTGRTESSQLPASVNSLQKATGLTAEQSVAINDVLQQLGVTDITVKAEPSMDNLQKAGEKAYSIKTKGMSEKEEIILLTAPDGSLYKVLYKGHDLYANGSIMAKLSDYRLSKEEWSDAVATTEVVITQFLQDQDSADFDLASWAVRKSPEGIDVKGKVTAKNGLGMKVKSTFIVIYTPDMKQAQKITINGKNYGSLTL